MEEDLTKTLMEALPRNPIYLGYWKTSFSDFSIKEQRNVYNKPIAPKYNLVPWRARLIGVDGTQLSLIAILYDLGISKDFDKDPCMFWLLDFTREKELGCFSESGLKEWFDKMNIRNRPHYHVVARRTRELYNKVRKAWDKVREENPEYWTQIQSV